MSIRFFDIAVEELHLMLIFQGQGKAAGNQGLSRAPFAASDRDYHLLLSHHHRAAFRAGYGITGDPNLMRSPCPTTRAETTSSGTGSGACPPPFYLCPRRVPSPYPFLFPVPSPLGMIIPPIK